MMTLDSRVQLSVVPNNGAVPHESRLPVGRRVSQRKLATRGICSVTATNDGELPRVHVHAIG